MMADMSYATDTKRLSNTASNNNMEEQIQQQPRISSAPPRPVSSASSQLSFSDHIVMGGDDVGGNDADEDTSSLHHHQYSNQQSQFGESTRPGSSTCSSSFNLHRQSSSGSQQEGQQQHHENGVAGTANKILNVVNCSGGGVGDGLAVNSNGGNAAAVAAATARTTTISTIAMESNTSATSKCSPTRLVIALLQTPHQALQLKIIELSPNLLKLPDNLPEAEDYLKNHSQVIKNLQSKQSPVEELLRQADKLLATQKPRAEVYAAMADSLGQTWKDLNGILDERRIVIDLAYNCHKVIQSCIDRINELHTAYSKFNYIPTIEDQYVQGGKPQDVAASIKKLKEDRADLLKRVSQALDACQQLLNKITDFNFSIDSRQLFLKRDVDYATKQVHRWLERLHDRRMILEEKLKMKREQFEEMADFLIHDKEMSGLLQELDRLRRASQEFSLGHSVQSAESQRDELENMVKEMKVLQERALLTARKLEQDENISSSPISPASGAGATKGRFYQRSGLKQKIYEILGTVNDLITESIDFELSLVDAKEFFHLADMANAKLDELAAAASSASSSAQESTRVLPKSQINSLTFDALSKGQILLDSLGWDSPRTRGVRGVYEELNKRKAVIQDEIEHLELLDEYNHFLEKVNQAYQNILNVETSNVRQPKTLPVDLLLVSKFREEHERLMEDLSEKTNFKELLSTLEQIYPGLTEQEKIGTEGKVNQLKSLSNNLVELIHQRIWLAGEWHKILELDRNEWSILNAFPMGSSSGKEISKRIHDVRENFIKLYVPIQQQLNEIHRNDPDLITSKMEQKMEEILTKYRSREGELAAVHKIHDICQAYKVKLDQHLLGNTVPIEGVAGTGSPLEPSYFPVLDEGLVATTLRSEGKPSTSLQRIIREQLVDKLSSTLQNFFQPLLTNFRQEILQAQEGLVGSQLSEKTTEELSWERYFERLKESYVKVTTELESYLNEVTSECRQVEEFVGRELLLPVLDSPSSVERIEKELNQVAEFRRDFERRMEHDLKGKLDKVLSIVSHEEPPIQAEKEEKTLRMLTASIIQDQLDSSISQKQDNLTRQLTEKMIHNDLDMINRTLNELISELEHPCNYGNNLRDAQSYLASFERFEKTVETLRDKLSRLLTTAGMPETDVKAQNLLGKLNLLVDRKGKRRELILLSLDYFRLIEKSYEHYDQVNKEIDEIIVKSKQPNIRIEDIEGLLKQLEGLKWKEWEQEKRLNEIERISKIIFDVSQEEETRQHYPLRDHSVKMNGEIVRIESDLTSLLYIIRSQSEPVLPPKAPSPLEMELESQILVETKPKLSEKVIQESQKVPLTTQSKEKVEEVEVLEELIVPTKVIRPKSQEMFTQTSTHLMDEEELEAKTREYLKEKERMTMAVLDVLRQSMSPLPPPHPQTVEKETQFEDIEEVPKPREKIDRDTITQTIDERRRSFETQTEDLQPVKKGVEISTDTEEIEYSIVEATTLLQQQQQQQRPPSRECFNPMFVEPLKDLVVNEGEKVVLECKTTGRIQKLVWLKDGLEIKNNPDYKTDFLDGSTARLTVDEVLPEDSAIFTCRAFGEGENVMVETSGRLTIREPVTSVLVPPRFLPHSPVSVGEHGKSHVIQVKVEGNPLPTVQWFKDGQCIDTSPDYIITFNNGLCEVQFDELVKDMDDGCYICVGTNKMGDCETKVELQITGDVDLSRKLSRLPPRIIRPLPKNLMSRAGQKVKLECEFESHTDFNVIWLKDDNKILTKTNSSAEITTQGSTTTLVFNEAYPVISGKYTVLVRNAGGECQSDSQILVKGLLPAETSDSELNISDGEAVKPTIKMPLKDVRGRVGDTLVLDCVIVGNPEPEVIWYKNAVPLKESPTHHLLFQGDKCSLIVDQADLSDNGMYSVSALNNCGEASSKCQVFVFDRSPEVLESKPVQPPTFKKMIQDEMVTAGNEFSFQVEINPDPENPGLVTDVTWWKNNQQLFPILNRIKILKDGLRHQLTFEEIDLQDKGNYMVKAVNSGGDAKCFGCLIVKENLEKMGQDAPKETEQKVIAPTQPSKQIEASPPAQQKVITKAIVKPPRFVIPLEGKMVDEGDKNVTLKCKIAASPPAIVKWLKNNSTDPLEPSPESGISLSYNERNGDIELCFSTVNVKDGGRYTCQATNEHGDATSVSDLVVKKTNFPPVFSKRLQSTTIAEGKRIYLEVDVYGKPSPEVEWLINENPIKNNPSEGITLKSDSPTRHSLIIASATGLKHSGLYKVIARNGAGEATCSCTINVVGILPPEAVPLPSKITQYTMFPGPPPIEMTESSKKIESSSQNLTSNTETKNEQISNLVESKTTTTTIYTSKEEHMYETRMTEVISPIPHAELDSLTVRHKPVVVTPTPPPCDISKQDTIFMKPSSVPPPMETAFVGEELVPGPEPEILVAPSLSSTWAQSKNQVLQKIKKFEEETVEAAASPPVEGPVGGVRIIPIHKSDSTPPPHIPQPSTKPPVTPSPSPVIASTDFGIPISPLPPPHYEEYLTTSADPVTTYDSTSRMFRDSYKTDDHTFVQREESYKEEKSSSTSKDLKYIRPSKFIPEKMRESDHDSEVESTIIPPKWVPPSTPIPASVTSIPVSTHSAFVPITPTTITQTATVHSSNFPVPPSDTESITARLATSETIGVKSIAKKWPPQSLTFQETTSSSSEMNTMKSSLKTGISTLSTQTAGESTTSRLSPMGYPSASDRHARSPTPNKEALEMDKLWSKPIRFSSPVTVPQSTSIPAQTLSTSAGPQRVLSPTNVKKQKPEVPPKPTSSPSSTWMKRITPQPYSPVTSPLPPPHSPVLPTPSPSFPSVKPEVPPKPSYLKSASPYSPQPSPLPTSSSRPVSATPGRDTPGSLGSKEALYYVSTVSTPRTTPVPPQLLTGWTSPLPTTPEVPGEQSYSSGFHEKREFFESTTFSSSTMEETSSSTHKQFSSTSSSSNNKTTSSSRQQRGITSPTFMDFHPSGISLLEQSFLPPPGEPPVFMYAPPPPTPAKPGKPAGITSQSYASSSTSKSSFMQSSSTGIPSSLPSSGKKQVTIIEPPSSKATVAVPKIATGSTVPSKLTKPIVIISSSEEQQHRETETFSKAFTQETMDSSSTSSSSVLHGALVPFRRKEDVPYIRPTKFIPVLDYFTASSSQETGEAEIRTKWKPGEEEEKTKQLSSWRKVTYEPPSGGIKAKPRRDSIGSLVENTMQDMNKQFKANISQLSQGLCYNRMDRKIQSDLSGLDVKPKEKDANSAQKGKGEKGESTASEGGTGVEDTNPLIYFKYDFGYEFGIASPRNVRASSEPPSKNSLPTTSPSSSSRNRPTSWISPVGRPNDDDDAPIILPIIHETTNQGNNNK